MKSSRFLALLLMGWCGSLALAVDLVGVSGSSIRYPSAVTEKIGDQQVNLVLTGTALRTKLFFNVYAIGSYLQEGVAARTPEALASANCPKRLHLIMERDVGGRDMAEAFRAAIRQNYASPQFTDEINTLVEFIQARDARKGDQFWLTNIPKVGVHIQSLGKSEILIRNPDFSRAVWDIYLGKNNLGETIKQGLVSRL